MSISVLENIANGINICNILYDIGIPRDLTNLMKYYLCPAEGSQYLTRIGHSLGGVYYQLDNIYRQPFQIKCKGFFACRLNSIIYGFDKQVKSSLEYIMKAINWTNQVPSMSIQTNNPCMKIIQSNKAGFEYWNKLPTKENDNWFAIIIDDNTFILHYYEMCEFIIQLGFEESHFKMSPCIHKTGNRITARLISWEACPVAHHG